MTHDEVKSTVHTAITTDPVITKGPEPVIPATVISEPTYTTATPVQPQTGGAGKCILIGCIVVLLCCICTVVLGFVGVYFGGASLISSNKTADPTLTRLQTETEVQAAYKAVNDENVYKVADPISGDITFHLTEKDLLGLMMNDLKNKIDPQAIGIKITPSDFKIEVELSALGNILSGTTSSTSTSTSTSSSATTSTSTSSVSYDLQGLKGAYASLDFGIGTDGTSIIVKNISTGNGMLDSLFGSQFKQSFQDSLSTNLADELANNGIVIKKITLGSGYIDATFSETAPITPTVTK